MTPPKSKPWVNVLLQCFIKEVIVISPVDRITNAELRDAFIDWMRRRGKLSNISEGVVLCTNIPLRFEQLCEEFATPARLDAKTRGFTGVALRPTIMPSIDTEAELRRVGEIYARHRTWQNNMSSYQRGRR
jgi:hypothetical protein